MNRKSALLSLASIAIALGVGPGTVRALHLDVLNQQVNGQLVTGTGDFDHDQWTLGERVFHRDFGSTFAINNPGYNSIGAGSPDIPVGAQALPGNSVLSWDFLPMTINNASQNLFYWNGQDTDGLPGLTPNDVKFGALPGPNYTLTLFDINNGAHATDGTNTIVPGGPVATTGSDGFVHQHLFYFLQDNDGDSGTKPADGLYLVAERMKMPGLTNSLPVFFVFGTPGSSVPAEDDAAVPWVEQQLNIPGDYNRNGVVDAADYALWRKTLNSPASPQGSGADGNGNGNVDADDLTFWRQHFGQTSRIIVNTGSGAGASESLLSGAVPEPATMRLFLCTCAAAIGMGRRGRRPRRATTADDLTNTNVFFMTIGYDAWRNQLSHSTAAGVRHQANATVSRTAKASPNNAFARKRKLVGLLGQLDQLIARTKLLLLQPIDDVGLARIFKQLDDMQKARQEVEAELSNDVSGG